LLQVQHQRATRPAVAAAAVALDGARRGRRRRRISSMRSAPRHTPTHGSQSSARIMLAAHNLPRSSQQCGRGAVATVACSSNRLLPTLKRMLAAARSHAAMLAAALCTLQCAPTHTNARRWRNFLSPEIEHPRKSPFTEWEIAVVVQVRVRARRRALPATAVCPNTLNTHMHTAADA
jgi:hypothetical protein